MRFTIRAGTSASAIADPVMLRALGLPHGGLISVGKTHTRVTGGDTNGPTDLLLDDKTMSNAELRPGASIDVKRVILPVAEVVQFGEHQLEARVLARALQGAPITAGDHVTIEAGYFGGDHDVDLTVTAVEPDIGVVGSTTRFAIGSVQARSLLFLDLLRQQHDLLSITTHRPEPRPNIRAPQQHCSPASTTRLNS